MTTWKWFLSSFEHDYKPGRPDFKKIIAFLFSVVLAFIAVWLIIFRPGNEELVVWCLSMSIAGLVGFNMAPIFNKTASAIKSQEMAVFVPPPTQKPTDEPKKEEI